MCTVANCEKEIHSKGYCQAHYRLFKKYGSPTVLAPTERRKPGPAPREKKPNPAAQPKSINTHCKKGHEYTEENTYVHLSGARQCRSCNKERARLSRGSHARINGEEPNKRGITNSIKTHCPYGHEYTEENTLFHTNRTSISGYSRACRECARANGNRQVIKKYGISLERFDEMLRAQDHKCAICKVELSRSLTAICVDHDHVCCPTGGSCGKCVRGLLCHDCNTGLGRFKDNVDYLEAAIEYLKTH